MCRLAGVKKAADAAGRKVCFMGVSLNAYLEAAHREGIAPFSPDDIIPINGINDMNPNELLIVTTGSQVILDLSSHRVCMACAVVSSGGWWCVRTLSLLPPPLLCLMIFRTPLMILFPCSPSPSMLRWLHSCTRQCAAGLRVTCDEVLCCSVVLMPSKQLLILLHVAVMAGSSAFVGKLGCCFQPDLTHCAPARRPCSCGVQAEPRAQLALASRQASQNLKLLKDDLLLYAARVIPGNDTRVTQMMNSIAEQGTEIAMGRSEALHTSGHAYK